MVSAVVATFFNPIVW